MKTIILILLLTVIATTLSALEPSKVAYYTNNTAAQNVYVELKDYTTSTMLFRGETFSLTPNDNGIVIVDVNDYPGGGATGDWSGINASVINTSTMLDIYVNGTLFSQKRYDQLILVQAEATVLDNSGNFNPQTLNGTIGTDDNRWEDVYIGGNTLHIGPDDGDANNTEMELSYSGNTGTVSVDNTPMLDITTTGIESNGNIILGTANSSISNSASTQVEFADNIYLQPNNDLVFEGQSAILTNSTAPIRVEDDLAVGVSGGANDKFYVSLSNGNTRIDGDLTLTGSAGSGTRLVTANTSGVLSAGTALPAGTIVGTTETQTLTNKLIDADNNTISNIDNGNIKANAGIDATKLADGSVSSTELQRIGSLGSAAVGITDTQTLTSKSIDADNNTIINIENADIKANAGIDATKIADGSVTSTELQYINSVTSNVQTQLDGKQANLPSQSGNSGRYLTTDGTSLSWGTVSGGGGGTGGGEVTTATTVALTPIPTTYTSSGAQLTVEANTTYIVRGFYQEDDGSGGSGQFDGRIQPIGGATITYAHFTRFGSAELINTTTVEFVNKGATNDGLDPELIHGIIRTGNAGSIQLQFRENVGSSNTVDLDAGGKLSLIKIGGSSSGGGSGSSEVYTEANSNTTLTTDDQVVYISGNYTVTLPDPPETGQTIKFISDDVNATLNPQTKVIRDRGTDYPGTSDLQDFGGANQYQLTLYYNGTKWLPISK
ncbi:MAG: hypothetical protein ACE364_07695 [Chlorobiota bacterium]